MIVVLLNEEKANKVSDFSKECFEKIEGVTKVLRPKSKSIVKAISEAIQSLNEDETQLPIVIVNKGVVVGNADLAKQLLGINVLIEGKASFEVPHSFNAQELVESLALYSDDDSFLKVLSELPAINVTNKEQRIFVRITSQEPKIDFNSFAFVKCYDDNFEIVKKLVL